MNPEVAVAEARKIMDTEIYGLYSLPYAELVSYLEPVAHEAQAPSGRILQIEIIVRLRGAGGDDGVECLLDTAEWESRGGRPRTGWTSGMSLRRSWTGR